MAKRKIVWSNQAKIKLYDILSFYAERNKSKTFSVKLYKRFNNELLNKFSIAASGKEIRPTSAATKPNKTSDSTQGAIKIFIGNPIREKPLK